jgi:hypothetical protein
MAVVIAALALASASQAQSDYHASMVEADRQIAAAEHAHSEVVQNEEYLSTMIGPRLTGSPGMQRASQWTLDLFRKYGLDARLETATIPHAWSRGNDWGALVAPMEHWMTVRSAAWSPATPGVVTGRLVAIDSTTTPEAITSHAEQYKGAIVLTEDWPPCSIDLPEHPANAYDAVVTPTDREILRAFLQGGPAEKKAIMDRYEKAGKVLAALAPAGAVAILRNSCMPDAMLHMGGAGDGPLPVAYVSYPDYRWLRRLAAVGQGIFRLNLAGKLSDRPGSAANTVAQIKGTEHPDEEVILGAHLDSWDLAEGAVDNGTGAMAVLEAARLLKSLGWKPKRTLTFVLFYGEEQGEQGSRKFIHDHAGELPKIDACLIDDIGAGRVLSLSLGDQWSTGRLMADIYRPLQEVFGLDPITNEELSGSDHDQFQIAGVPAYLASQAPAHYGYAHHSTDDVYELVEPDALEQQAAVLASWMWNVSEMPDALPHQPARPEP